MQGNLYASSGTFISIHAPREGGDEKLHTITIGRKHFNPRPPRGGRLNGYDHIILTEDISIHAPREGGDVARCADCRKKKDFNPRPPRGGRPD